MQTSTRKIQERWLEKRDINRQFVMLKIDSRKSWMIGFKENRQKKGQNLEKKKN